MDIATIAKKAEPIFRRNLVSYAGIFGSRARGDNRPDSDVDFVVKFFQGATLLTLARVQRELSETLKMKADVVTQRSIHPELRFNIDQDTKKIYEEKQ